ncbi:MAG: hypothetical protein ACJ798_16860 [Phenylobacterium sp.]
MSEDAMEESLTDVGPVLSEPANGEVVHWMDKPPITVGIGGLSATAVGAFALGAVAAVAVFALAGWLPEREYLVRRRRADFDS